MELIPIKTSHTQKKRAKLRHIKNSVKSRYATGF